MMHLLGWTAVVQALISAETRGAKGARGIGEGCVAVPHAFAA